MIRPDGWSFPLQAMPKTTNTRFRALLAVCHISPLPGREPGDNRPAEIRYYLKQWGPDAKEPYSWCIDEMKFAAKSLEDSMDPFQPLQHVQVAEVDWSTYFATWRDELYQHLMGGIDRLKTLAPLVQEELKIC